MEQPEKYKMVSAARYLQRRGDELQAATKSIDTSRRGGASSKAMQLVEAENLREVGNWLEVVANVEE